MIAIESILVFVVLASVLGATFHQFTEWVYGRARPTDVYLTFVTCLCVLLATWLTLSRANGWGVGR